MAIMFRIFLIFIFLVNSAFASEIFNSGEGLKKLERSQFKNDFYALINFYQPQINSLYCSAASSVVVLNAINKKNIFVQESFFNEKTNKIKLKSIIDKKQKNQDGIFDAGLSLADLARILNEVYNLKVEIFYAADFDEKSINNFRQILKEVLNENEKFILANFDGRVVNQATSGHISPIAAFDEESDSLLVLDVALHKNQWFWVDLRQFYKSMHTKDGETFRGFLLVRSATRTSPVH
jgi:hypothetical protein